MSVTPGPPGPASAPGTVAGVRPAGPDALGAAARPGRTPSPGRLLTFATAAPAVALSAWLVAAVPLLALGVFTPVMAAVVAGPAVLLALALAARWAPRRSGIEAGGGWDRWWPLLALLAVAVGFTVLQLLHASEQIVIRRDAGSYAQFGNWLALHGSLPVPQYRELIAGDDPALSYQSLAYYQVGDVIWPQFMAGVPLTLAIGHWIGGVHGMLAVAPVLGGLAVLAFGGVAARLVGPRWAPVAALALAVCLPQMWVSRSTYSEPAAQILLLGGMALVVDALAPAPPGGRRRIPAGPALAALGGLALGLSVVVRIDGLRDMLPVLPFIAVLLHVQRSRALALAGGLAVGAGYGLAAGYGLSLPYLQHLAASVVPLLVVCAAAVLASAGLGWAVGRWGLPDLRRGPWAGIAAGAVVAVMAALAVRPLLYTARGHAEPAEGTRSLIGQLQQIEGLPFDPDRTYAESTLNWVAWYVGVPVVVLATAGAALVAWRLVRRRDLAWALPLLMMAWTVVTVLVRPAITPDHPWASRRLVALVLPAFILLAVWAVASGVRWLRGSGAGARLYGAVSVLAVGAVLASTGAASVPLVFARTDAGSVAAVERLCERIGPGASVLMVDGYTADRFNQLVRGMCGLPVARLADGVPADPATVARIAAEIRERGRRPVIVGDEEADLLPFLPPGASADHAFELRGRTDALILEGPPARTGELVMNVWIAEVPESAAPAPSP
ncbi:hypothetical protein [Allonocardiopsis opalescens]|uniref:4-amino-4-deoxy-L-arabinose transferase-like glycosyltransferase n=1 Tax=Allonocardiopsis opalescens TaxID=1144618 RepID=A0A2T0QBZ4_9ACTN|nr:hypothetical protein [Allonocardiopsis opalescens]PRY01474.1 hypothetical protein CLV72_10156 [Allonocardiopsis opalescens]